MDSLKRFNVVDNLVVLYGIDASGKTTLAKKVKKVLEEEGYLVYHIKMPSESIWGKTQRGILYNGGGRKKAALFGILDFLSLIPSIESARIFDNEVKRIKEQDLCEGDIDILEKKLKYANDFSRVVYIMERHPLFDAIGYLPELKNSRIYDISCFLMPKPGLAIRLKTPPRQAYERVKKRGHAESTEDLESLIEADRNFDEINISGVSIVEVDSSDEHFVEETAMEIIKYLKRHKSKRERRIKKGLIKSFLKAKKIIHVCRDYLSRET